MVDESRHILLLVPCKVDTISGPAELGWQLPPQYFDFFKVSTKKELKIRPKLGVTYAAATPKFWTVHRPCYVV